MNPLKSEKLENLEKHYEKLGPKLAGCLDVKAGEHILVSGGVHQFGLLREVCSAIALKKAFYHLDIALGDDVAVQVATEVSNDFADRPISGHDRYQACLYDAALCINSTLDEKIYSQIPDDKRGLGMKRGMELNDLAKARKRRSIFMAWPTEQKAAECNMSLENFEKLFIKCMNIDLDELASLGQRIKSFLSDGGDVKITSKSGTDLSFYLDPKRRIMIDAGSFDQDMVDQGDITKNQPCGEVYTTAVESTVEGVAVFDLAFVEGKPIENLRLTFKKGSLVKYTADKGIELFEKRYNLATGDKDKIGELGIGINPAMTRPIGHTLLDEKIFGSIHLALGENRMYGGINNSSMHWDLVMQGPTLRKKGKVLIDSGVFQV